MSNLFTSTLLQKPSAEQIYEYLDKDDRQFVDLNTINRLLNVFESKTVQKINTFQQQYPEYQPHTISIHPQEFAVKCIMTPLSEFNPAMNASQLSSITSTHVYELASATAQKYRNTMSRHKDDEFVRERQKQYTGDPSGLTSQYLLQPPPGVKKTAMTLTPMRVDRKRIGKNTITDYQASTESFSSSLKQMHLNKLNQEHNMKDFDI